ncbi:MAG: hypothetical protein FJ207_07860 [Gemmatimonadetes bacterium]|nr:hypothetical protein [Gemmatimonadota bacterium]
MAQIDQDLFRRMQEAALRFRSGESDFEEIMTPNGPAHLVRDPTNALGFRIDFVAGASRHSVSVQEYPPSPGRPHGYPAPLPFLPNCRTTVNTLDQAVSWHDVGDVYTAVASVDQQCEEDGWSSVDATATPVVDGRLRTFRKDDKERELRLEADDGPPRLVLVERRS